MTPNKRQSLAEKKQRLLAEIAQQRIDLSTSSQHWLKITAPYDRTWQTLVSLRPLLIAGASLLSLYSLRHPKKLVTLGKRAIGTWGIIRTLRNTFGSTPKS
nr:YqjK-like family protein [uncultured Moellerella sp.]